MHSLQMAGVTSVRKAKTIFSTGEEGLFFRSSLFVEFPSLVVIGVVQCSLLLRSNHAVLLVI